MTDNKSFKIYTNEIDNSEKVESLVWNVIHETHEERTEQFSDFLYQSGPKKILKKDLLHLIRLSKKMLIVSSFLFADEEIKQELIKAAQRGVNIYFLLAATGRLEREPNEDSEFEQKVYKEHIAMLNELSPYIYIRSANHFHAKIVITDPFSRSPRGMLLTANLTKDALQRNEELAYFLSQEQARDMGSVLKYIFWEESEHHTLEGSLTPIDPSERIVPPSLDSGVYYNSKTKNTLSDRVLELINSAKKEIVFSTFGIEEDHEVFQRLIERLSEGVKVKLFARYSRSKMNPVFKILSDAGAEIYGFKWLHAKAFLIDQNQAFILTANIEQHGMDDGFELGIDIPSDDIESIQKLFQEWEDKHLCRFYSQASLGTLSKSFYQYDSGIRQYRLEKIKGFQELAPLKQKVQSEEDLKLKESEFNSLIKQAKALRVLKVKIQIEKTLVEKKKKKARGEIYV